VHEGRVQKVSCTVHFCTTSHSLPAVDLSSGSKRSIHDISGGLLDEAINNDGADDMDKVAGKVLGKPVDANEADKPVNKAVHADRRVNKDHICEVLTAPVQEPVISVLQ